ncbi:hypothetical protein K439DRAFT_1625017 [Ramaria rubella]|nr:hypothetical protein K439DRAFT_1625017 [Ramaria rubella]
MSPCASPISEGEGVWGSALVWDGVGFLRDYGLTIGINIHEQGPGVMILRMSASTLSGTTQTLDPSVLDEHGDEEGLTRRVLTADYDSVRPGRFVTVLMLRARRGLQFWVHSALGVSGGGVVILTVCGGEILYTALRADSIVVRVVSLPRCTGDIACLRLAA